MRSSRAVPARGSDGAARLEALAWPAAALGGALATVAYLAVTALMVAAGVAEPLARPGLRLAVIGVVGVAMLTSGLALRRNRDASGSPARRRWPSLLAGFGVVFFALGALDHLVLGSLQVRGLAVDVVFHAVGPALAAVGLVQMADAGR